MLQLRKTVIENQEQGGLEEMGRAGWVWGDSHAPVTILMKAKVGGSTDH